MRSQGEHVVRIFSDGVLQGAGFAIRADLVLTCAHVVLREDATITVDSFSRDYSATAAAWDEDADLCVLELKEPLAGFDPPPFAIGVDIVGHPFRTIGFPKDYDAGKEATGVIGQRLLSGRIQLDAVRQPGQAIVPGFSGAPVWDDQLRAVVGIVAAHDEQPTKSATMIPLDTFARAFAIAVQAMAEIFRDRWRRWEEAQRATIALQAALAPPSMHVRPSVATRWEEFAREPAWHERVNFDIGALIRASEGLDLPRRLKGVLTTLSNIDCDVSYPELLNALRVAIPDTLVGDIRALVRQEEEWQRQLGVARATSERWSKLRDMQQSAYSLGQEAYDPRFGRCFLLAGRFGSGKTHFCTSLLASDHPYGLHLPVELKDDEVGEAILAAARNASGIELESLAGLDAMLGLLSEGSEIDLPLFAHFDDVHLAIRRAPSLLANLARFIDGRTSLHSLRYVLTIQDAQYDRVAAQTEFWMRQTAVDADDDTPHAGGWIMLDDLNERSGTGLQILGSPGHQEELAYGQRVLSHPLTAVILVHLRKSGAGEAPAASLNFPEFVDDFWRRRKATLQLGSMTERDVDDAIALLAQAVADLGEAPPMRDLLRRATERDDVLGVAWSGERFNAALEVIETANLVRTELAVRDDPSSRRLLLLFDAFWSHRLAVVLMRELRKLSNTKKISRMVRGWFEQRELSSLAEGIVEFLLFLLVRDDEEKGEDRATPFARAAFAGKGMSPAAPWLAGAHLDAAVQKRFLDAGLPSIGGAADVRSTFSFLYFLRNAEVPPRERIEASSHAFDAVARHRLGAYFVYFFERTMQRFDSASDLAGALLSMNGVEPLEATPILADLSAMRLAELSVGDGILDVVIEHYLRPLSMRGPAPRLDDERWHRHFFREWLLHSVLGNLADIHHIDLHGMLSRRAWYDGPKLGIRFPITREMEREANIAIGARYRRGLSHQERDRYLDTLRDLIDSDDIREQVAAFFIIRHTEPPSENRRVRVRPEFHSMLDKLSRDTRVVGRVAAFAGVFEANVPHFASDK